MKKLGIVGAGAMGSALISGITRVDRKAWDLVVFEKNEERRCRVSQDYPGVTVVSSLSGLADCAIVIAAVKPVDLGGVLTELRRLPIDTVVSIAAGVGLQQIRDLCGKPAVRVMPNTPCLIGEGVSVVAFSDDVSLEAREDVRSIFGSVGSVQELPEKDFDVVTALSGCGPAYVYLFVEALIDAACSQGLSRDAARQLIVGTFRGSAGMLAHSALHPAQLRDQVTSPGGVTIKAIEVFEQRGLRGILWDAVGAAVARSQEMNKNS